MLENLKNNEIVKIINNLIKIHEFHTFSYIFIHFHTFSYIFINFINFALIFIDFHTFSLNWGQRWGVRVALRAHGCAASPNIRAISAQMPSEYPRKIKSIKKHKLFKANLNSEYPRNIRATSAQHPGNIRAVGQRATRGGICPN